VFVSVLSMAELPDGTTAPGVAGSPAWTGAAQPLRRSGDRGVGPLPAPGLAVAGYAGRRRDDLPVPWRQFDLESGRVVRPPLSTEWSAQLPRGVGQAVTALLPERPCPPLTRYRPRWWTVRSRSTSDAVLTAPATGGDERLSPGPGWAQPLVD
jgi:hypothetical protein